MIEDYASAASTLTQLRDMGIVISLDDFGTGYTSLRQIQAFPLDVVKLAATFTDTSIDADLSVLGSVVTMSSALGLRHDRRGHRAAPTKSSGCGRSAACTRRATSSHAPYRATGSPR